MDATEKIVLPKWVFETKEDSKKTLEKLNNIDAMKEKYRQLELSESMSYAERFSYCNHRLVFLQVQLT